MNNTSVLGGLRNRWWLILMLAAIGGALAAVPSPSQVGTQSEAARYVATHTMLLNDPALVDTGAASISANQVPLFATTGEVPERVRELVGFEGNSAQLADQIEVVFDPDTTALTFTTTQDTPELAVLIADTFADETASFLAERQDKLYEERLAASNLRLTELEDRLDTLTKSLASSPEDQTLLAQRDAVSRQYSVAFERNNELSANPTLLAFNTLARAQAVPEDVGGLGAPQSRLARALLGTGVGVVLGIAIASLLGRLDRRVRTSEQVELVTGLRPRVLIPEARDAASAAAILTPDRHDSLADSYRTLRNVVGFINSSMPPVERARITLVVSAGSGEGKTTVSSNLAATFAEAGMRTVAINTDFRRPQLSQRIAGGTLQLPYMMEDLAWVNPQELLYASPVAGVSLLDLVGLGTPDELARTTATLVPRLAEQVDAIVVDSSPVTATAEVLEMVPLADVVVVVVRLGRTQVDELQRTMATLRDLTTAPLLLVVVGVQHTRAYYYYDYHDKRRGSANGGYTSKQPAGVGASKAPARPVVPAKSVKVSPRDQKRAARNAEKASRRKPDEASGS